MLITTLIFSCVFDQQKMIIDKGAMTGSVLPDHQNRCKKLAIAPCVNRGNIGQEKRETGQRGPGLLHIEAG